MMAGMAMHTTMLSSVFMARKVKVVSVYRTISKQNHPGAPYFFTCVSNRTNRPTNRQSILPSMHHLTSRHAIDAALSNILGFA
mmetsp:Transcript_27624/g.77397  ORF Transcript_27624/g.77397 Transcript_27624/m.77397 type:complete len:83 (+) Transcript_27624:253-501(+)